MNILLIGKRQLQLKHPMKPWSPVDIQRYRSLVASYQKTSMATQAPVVSPACTGLRRLWDDGMVETVPWERRGWGISEWAYGTKVSEISTLGFTPFTSIHIHSRLRIQCLVNNVVDMLIPADLWLSCDPSPVSISVPLGSPKSPKRLGIAVVSQHLAAADCEFHPLWWNVKTSGMTCVENGHEKSVQGGAPMCPLVMIRCYKML
jgi:hypothetical protein